MKIYIHYNAYDFLAPPAQDDCWRNYTNPDSAKMFLVCAESWKRQGWTPVRLDTANVRPGFQFSGVLKDQPKFYPLELWNIWFKLTELAPCWVTSTDVINFGFIHPAWDKNVTWNMGDNAWTNAVMHVTPAFCDLVIRTVKAVDSGELPPPKSTIITDENIIRDCLSSVNSQSGGYYSHHWSYSRFCYLVNGPANPRCRLVHFPRSILRDGVNLYNETK